jgi:hypothetical protein
MITDKSLEKVLLKLVELAQESDDDTIKTLAELAQEIWDDLRSQSPQ